MVQAAGIRSSWRALTSSGTGTAWTHGGLLQGHKPIQFVQLHARCRIQSCKAIRTESDENVSFKARPAGCIDHETAGRPLRHTISIKYVIYDARVRISDENRGA